MSQASAASHDVHDLLPHMRESSEFEETAYLLEDMSTLIAGTAAAADHDTIVERRHHKIVNVEGRDGSEPSYQGVTGAPVESISPLGRHVGWMTVVGLNVGKMIGTGIFSTREFRYIPIMEF